MVLNQELRPKGSQLNKSKTVGCWVKCAVTNMLAL